MASHNDKFKKEIEEFIKKYPEPVQCNEEFVNVSSFSYRYYYSFCTLPGEIHCTLTHELHTYTKNLTDFFFLSYTHLNL